MTHEKARIFSPDRSTDHILRFYREIGDREGLKTWRDSIPPDVRRLWIAHMIEEAFIFKMTGDYFTERLGEFFTPEDVKRLTQMRSEAQQRTRDLGLLGERIQVLATQTPDWTTSDQMHLLRQQDQLFAQWDLLLSQVDALQEKYFYEISRMCGENEGSAIAKFSELYFTSFEKDEKLVSAFFERQTRNVQKTVTMLKRYLDWLTEDGWSVLSGGSQPHLLPAGYKVRGAPPQKSWSGDLAGVVVFGSSAIGPRDRSRYPKDQDLDALVLFQPEVSSSHSLASCMELFRMSCEPPHEKLRVILRACPGMEEFHREMNVDHGTMDVRFARLPYTPTSPDILEKYKDAVGKVTWWPFMSGPHRFIPVGDEPEASNRTYRVFRDRVVQDARALAREQVSATI